jgi:hypothetical protein
MPVVTYSKPPWISLRKLYFLGKSPDGVPETCFHASIKSFGHLYFEILPYATFPKRETISFNNAIWVNMVTFAKFQKMLLQVARERPGDYCEYKAGLMEMEN